MGLDVFRRKCGAHNRVLKLREACPDCVELARQRVSAEYALEFSRDRERGSYSGPCKQSPIQWVPVGLHPGSCEHRRTTPWGHCYDCQASSQQVVLDRLNRSLGFR